MIQSTVKTARRDTLWRQIKRNKVAYAYIAPFFILFAIFGLYPIFSGLYISFFRWDGVGAMKWKGLDNYARIFSDPTFLVAVKNTVFIGVIAHIPILLGGLVMAYILNSPKVRGKEIFKTIMFLPMVTSVVAITLVFQIFFGYNFGLLNYFMSFLKIPPVNWLGGSGEYIKTAVIIMFAWKWMGWNMVIYLAGMQGISNDVYEAATIDGARPTQTFFRITLPLLKPIILFTLIQSTIGTVNLFTEPYILTNSLTGGTNNQGYTMMLYLLNKAPKGNNIYGVASAVAYVICVAVIIISLLLQYLMSERDKPEKGVRRV
ncbi:MAG: sugar ABC transporter permease [Eubacteriales bacterium]|nr:sugar ABC transporter permease [Eubacteriales bacterium]